MDTARKAEDEDATGDLSRWIRERRWDAVGSWLKVRCPLWANAGEFAAMNGALAALPEKLLARDGWLSYWRGVSLLFFEPLRAQEYLERAFEKFVQRNSVRGQWCTVAAMLDAILLEYRDLRDMDPWIAWIDTQPDSDLKKLMGPERVTVVASIFFAFVFRQPQHPRVSFWRDRVQRLAAANVANASGLRLALELIVESTWRGDLQESALVFGRLAARPRIADELVATESRFGDLLWHLSNATLALHTAQWTICVDAIESGLACAERLDCHVWDSILLCHGVSVHCARGNVATAEQYMNRLEASRAQGYAFDEAYYRGMLLWIDYTRSDGAIGLAAKAQSALDAADMKGAPYFQAVCRIGAAAALHDSGARERASRVLAEAEQIAVTQANPVLQWMAMLLRAHFAYAQEQITVGDEILQRALQTGRELGLLTFFCWPRRIVARLLDRALELHIEREYVRLLSRTHHMRPLGHDAVSHRQEYPLEVRVFDQPCLRINGEPISAWPSSMPRQADLIASLLAHGGENVPVSFIARDLYQVADTDTYNSIKGIIRSFRSYAPDVEVMRLERYCVSIVWDNVRIDAAVLDRLIREQAVPATIRAWLQQHYRCDFLDSLLAPSGIVWGRREHYRAWYTRYLEAK